MSTDLQEIYANYWKIKAFQSELPTKVPVILSSGEPKMEAVNPQSHQFNIYFSSLKEGDNVLDIGAGEKQIREALLARGLKVHYYSMDSAIHENLIYEFSNLDEIHDLQFALIIMQEVIEHLPLEVGYSYLKKAFQLLNPGGWLAISTPNTRRPVQFHHSDFTHFQHYPLHDLYGLLNQVGFSCNAILRRIEIRNPDMSVKQKVLESISKNLIRFMGFDYAHGIMIKIQKA